LQKNWYEHFFHGVAIDLWRKAISPEQTEQEVRFLEKALALEPGASILDVPCGSGRHAIYLSKKGYRVTGVDISPESIDYARADAPGAEWRVGDMRDLPWRDEFDAAFCFGNSFGYLDRGEAAKFIKAVAASLKPRGRFAIDTGMAAESILPTLLQRRWHQIEDIIMLSENRYEVAESRLDITYTFIRDGTIDRRESASYVLTTAAIRGLLEEAGFHEIKMFGGTAGESFTLGSPRLIVTCELRE
jgi:SAM-dependent methyltransferase